MLKTSAITMSPIGVNRMPATIDPVIADRESPTRPPSQPRAMQITTMITIATKIWKLNVKSSGPIPERWFQVDESAGCSH